MYCDFTYRGESVAPRFDNGAFVHGDGLFRAVYRERKLGEATEWWLEIENPGNAPSGLVESLRFALVDTPCALSQAYPRLHTLRGSLAQADDFAPLEYPFFAERAHEFTCGGGRSSSGAFPYWNLQTAPDAGAFFAVGWSGQWAARFTYADKGVRFEAYKEPFRVSLLPGEKMELPHALTLAWRGCDPDESFNRFRKMMHEDILPRYDGKPLVGPVFLRGWGGDPAEEHIRRIRAARAAGLPAEAYQIDAGWHGRGGEDTSGRCLNNWWQNVGSWRVLPSLYPKGMREVSDAARAAGMKFSLWVEMERAMAGSLDAEANPEDYAYLPGSPSFLRHLGRPGAAERLADRLARIINDAGVDILRIDFNCEPLAYWQAEDGENRRGASEITYINGLYRVLDLLRARCPDVTVDNCASGGRRLDYRMGARSMPMVCRSDYFTLTGYDPEGPQGHAYGLSRFLPAHGDSIGSCTGNTPLSGDTYRARSSLGAGTGLPAPREPIADAEWYAARIREHQSMRAYMDKDYYPLTGYSLDRRDALAMQFHDPDAGRGFVAAYRRAECARDSLRASLRALDAGARYRFTDADAGELGVFPGGQPVCIPLPEPRACRIVFYEPV